MSALQEESVTFEGPCGKIEGRLGNGDKDSTSALLVLHPHPQYGGSMSNNIVKAVVRAGQRSGLATLRINFRGVGGSEGDFGGGIGEQDDVGVALDFIKRQIGKRTVALVGYSFGACVALRYCHSSDHGVDHLYLVAPVPFLLPKDLPTEPPVLGKIILGEMDQIAPLDAVRAMVSEERREAFIEVIPGADHFFSNKEAAVEKVFWEIFRAI